MTRPTRRIPGAGGPGPFKITDSSSVPTSVVLAIDPDRHTNAQLVADCARLGYLPEPVVDPTYGRGGMWTHYRPETLLAFDANPAKGVTVADLWALPLDDNSAGSLLLDPPYKLNGTPTSNHDGGMDDRYGNDRYRRPRNVTETYVAGITEAARVVRPRGLVLVKCMDQISNNRLQLQTLDVYSTARVLGLKVVDVLHLVAYRPQPDGTRQVHARRNLSTMIVLGVTK